MHRVITVEERARILELLNDSSYQVSAGGSLANTLASLARLGQADALMRGKHAALRVAAISIAGSDALGAFHTAQQHKAGVETLSEPLEGSSTGSHRSGPKFGYRNCINIKRARDPFLE